MILCRLVHFNATFLQNQEGGGEFKGGRNDKEFQKTLGEFDGRIRYVSVVSLLL